MRPQSESCACVTSQRLHHSTAFIVVCACVCVNANAYRAAVRHKKVQRRNRRREKRIAHTQISHIITHKHTHAARGIRALNHKTSNKRKNKKPKRGTTSAHTLIAPVKQNTHTHTERERGRPLNAMKTKQKETVTVLRPCSQAGRQRCVWCKREHQRACMGVHAYIQWAHYVCASWDEVRARVHARGHTQRVSERRVCVRAVHGSLPLTLTRPPPQQQPHTQQQEEAKEGRWCGRPRCCRHCRQVSCLFD
ncbi:hypothetical protein ECC02_011139 [Trypanosoma cruzi]|uniref:Uncharacterized protein n=1 Tax=Trypanosoma cruzi TaxID=5693 RepID=A0A7J6XPG1_TRYCR|nr:hypothetical protein ECC02_011139 [Trypanosoma cruzi]